MQEHSKAPTVLSHLALAGQASALAHSSTSSHEIPSPSYPPWHVHSNVPGRLLQSALTSQVESSVHSSISSQPVASLSRANPLGHEHEKEPSVFSQVSEQAPARHSSMS